MIIREHLPKEKIKIKGYNVNSDQLLENLPREFPNQCACMLFVGVPASGKTSLYISLLTKYYKKKFTKIYYFNQSLHTVSEKFLNKLSDERIFNSLEL